MPLTASANLGFLWKALPVSDRIARAAAAGFTVVEFHDELSNPALVSDCAAVASDLQARGVRVAGINALMGETAGLAALPGREAEARAAIDRAAEAAALVQAGALHVTAGRHGPEGGGPAADAAYAAALEHALSAWEGVVLMEPISAAAMPGYHLRTLDQAVAVQDALGAPARLKIMFDVFHVAMEADTRSAATVISAFEAVADRVGHVQIASVPDRAEPDGGELDLEAVLRGLESAGYAGAVGAEYRPKGAEEDGLGWREALGLA